MESRAVYWLTTEPSTAPSLSSFHPNQSGVRVFRATLSLSASLCLPVCLFLSPSLHLFLHTLEILGLSAYLSLSLSPELLQPTCRGTTQMWTLGVRTPFARMTPACTSRSWAPSSSLLRGLWWCWTQSTFPSAVLRLPLWGLPSWSSSTSSHRTRSTKLKAGWATSKPSSCWLA